MCDGGLVPDVMHDLLEGALQYEVKLMLRSYIRVEHYFTLENFNQRLVNFELGYMEIKDRPTAISETTLLSTGHSIKQNGKTQMFTGVVGSCLPLWVLKF